jgi:hypothetical protein
LPGLIAAYASLKRIQGFLILDEKESLSQTKHLEESKNNLQSNQQSPVPDAPGESQRTVSIALRGTFSWDKGSVSVLKDINLHLPSNQLTICVGPVASVSIILEPHELYISHWVNIGQN